MAVIQKPSEKPEWASGESAAIIAPSLAKRALGWIAEKPPRQIFNWLLNRNWQWINYFENRTDALLAEYDAIIGSVPGASYLTINDMMADSEAASFKRVLVATSPGEDQVISRPGMEFIFKPQAVVSKVSSNTGLTVSANGTKIVGAKFSGFSGGTGKGIVIGSGIKNCLVTQCSFNSCDTDIDDQGTNNNLVANLVEA